MRNKRRNLYLLLFILLFPVIRSAAQQESVFRKFAGEYVTGHEFGGGLIKLDADRTFSDESGSDDGTEISSSGNYAFSDGILRFKITRQTGKRRDGEEFNLLNLEEYRRMFRDPKISEIKTEYRLLPVEWSERLYLIDESDLKAFANAVNLGIEPRTSLFSRRYSSPWFGSFYLRSGDELKKPSGKPKLPAEWLSFLLPKPLTATVIGVQKVDKTNKFVTVITAIVNKGSRDGLKVGMKLLAKDEVPSPWDGIEVISVGQRTSKIEARMYGIELKAGEKLTTRYKPKLVY